MLIIEYLLECSPHGIYSISRAQATCGLPARLERLHHVSASEVSGGVAMERCHDSFFTTTGAIRHTLSFTVQSGGRMPERANRLCRQDAFLKKCFLALDKLAGSFCLFPSSREIS